MECCNAEPEDWHGLVLADEMLFAKENCRQNRSKVGAPAMKGIFRLKL
jgi:hypothetical protein